MSTRKLAIAREGVSTDRCEVLSVGEAIRKRTMDSLRQVLRSRRRGVHERRKPGVRVSISDALPGAVGAVAAPA